MNNPIPAIKNINIGGTFETVIGGSLEIVDINGDQFKDVVFYTGLDSIAVIKGGQDINNIEYQILGHENLSQIEGNKILTVGDIEGDGDYELIALVNPGDFDTINSLEIFNLPAEGNSLLSVTSGELKDIGANFQQFARFALEDLDNDGFNELILFNAKILADRSLENIAVFDDEGAQDGNLYNLTPANIITDINTNPLGDLDGNGKLDFLHQNESEFLISELSSNYELTNTTPVPVESDITFFTDFDKLRNIAGDFDGDGNPEFHLQSSSDGSVGSDILAMDENRVISTVYRSEISIEEYGRRTILFTTNLGDLNGDGIDDLGVSLTGSGLSRFEIYWGGNDNFNTPDIIIDADASAQFWSPATGDFNNDGFRDLVLVESSSRDLLFYNGTATFDNQLDKRIELEQIDPEFDNSTPVIANIGDINMDGVDDLVYSVSSLENKSFVILGGSTLSNTFDFEIPFTAQAFAPLGDIGQDGTADFAMGDWDFQDDSRSFTGAVRIYSSYDESAGESFDSETFYQLTMPQFDQSTGDIFFLFGFRLIAGDLNGDNITDLVTTSFQHENNNSGEGLDAIFVYFGGENFDEEPDRSFPLPVQSDRLSSLILMVMVQMNCFLPGQYLTVFKDSPPMLTSFLEKPRQAELVNKNRPCCYHPIDLLA
mgnify:CR=1 FL=1